MTPESSESLVGIPEVVAGFQVLRLLSSGGMGQVVLAKKESSGGFEKHVAIKLVHPHLATTEKYRALFLREARVAATLNHPNICQVFDFGEDRGFLYLVMEYVPGVSVRKIWSERGAELEAGLAALIVAQAARGLYHAHSARSEDGNWLGIIHRDVSPQNLMVADTGHTKVLDFGLAKQFDERSDWSSTGEVLGKPAYMAPEQARSRPLDHRADIFSLGVVLHELLSGERLFVAPSALDTLRAVTEAPIPDLTAARPDLDPKLVAVARQMLTRNRDRRASSADAVASVLEEVAHDATPPATPHRLATLVAELDGPSAPEASVPRSSPRNIQDDRPTTPLGRPTTPLGPRTDRTPPSRRRRWLASSAAAVVLLGLGVGYTLMPDPSATANVPASVPNPTKDAYSSSAPKTTETPNPDAAGSTGNETAATDEASSDSNPRDVPDEAPKTKPPARRRPRKRAVRRDTSQPEPPPVQPTGVGALTVTAQTYGQVYVDGKALGPTPVVRHPLPAGEHRLEVKAPDTGLTRHTETIEIEAGRIRRVKLE